MKSNLVFSWPGEPVPQRAEVEALATVKGQPVEYKTVRNGAEAWEIFLSLPVAPAQVFHTPGADPTFWEFFDRAEVTLIGGELV